MPEISGKQCEDRNVQQRADDFSDLKKHFLHFCMWCFSKKSASFINCKPYVTLDHKTSLKLQGYCGNSQQNTVWVKIIDFSFMPKVIRILSKDHDPLRYLVNFLP